VKRLTEAVHVAAHAAATQMTSDIRHSALSHNWHPDVVRNTHVKYEDGKFGVHVHPDYEDRAFVHEFGNQSNQPTAVLRKYEHQSQNATKMFADSFMEHLGGKL
jgi:2,4-dienoyl-CoA reductase-like NADH-dependent reductase (Old Yellow Enzyme family)